MTHRLLRGSSSQITRIQKAESLKYLCHGSGSESKTDPSRCLGIAVLCCLLQKFLSNVLRDCHKNASTVSPCTSLSMTPTSTFSPSCADTRQLWKTRTASTLIASTAPIAIHGCRLAAAEPTFALDHFWKKIPSEG